jgi:hypothetical protein
MNGTIEQEDKMAEGPISTLPKDNVVRTAYDQNGNTCAVWIVDDRGILQQSKPGLYSWWKDGIPPP